MPLSEVISQLIVTIGAPLTIVVWLLFGLGKLVSQQAPASIKWYQDRKTGQFEHDQELEERRVKHEELMQLTEAGSRTYTEEQLTSHLSEVYDEFKTTNAFIRDSVFTTLQRMELKLDQLLVDVRRVEPMTEKIAEIRMYVRAINKDRVNLYGYSAQVSGESGFNTLDGQHDSGRQDEGARSNSEAES